MTSTPIRSRSTLVRFAVLGLLCAAGCAGSGLSVFSLLSSGLLLMSLVFAACSDSHRDNAGSGGTSAGDGGSPGMGGAGGSAGVGGVSGMGGVGGTSGMGGDGGTAGEYCTTYVECIDGVPHDVMGCCPEGAVCNFWSAEICADGSCVQLGEQCIEDCDGTIEQTCAEGVLVDVCCPAGSDCDYGLYVEICADGSCALDPDICIPEGCFRGLDCVEGLPYNVAICGCDITICNYFPATLCDDGSCVPPGQTCAL